MLPTYDGTHVAEGLKLFTDYIRKQPNATKLTATYLRRVQELEDAIWQVVNSRLLVNNPTGDVLTKLGKLVGQPRGSLTDTDMLVAVKLRILANRSSGLSNDAIKIASTLSPSWGYHDLPIASFIAETYNITSADMAQQLLSAATPGGVYGVLYVSDWTDGADFEPGSVYDAAAGQLGFGSVYDATVGGLAVSARVL